MSNAFIKIPLPDGTFEIRQRLAVYKVEDLRDVIRGNDDKEIDENELLKEAGDGVISHVSFNNGDGTLNYVASTATVEEIFKLLEPSDD